MYGNINRIKYNIIQILNTLFINKIKVILAVLTFYKKLSSDLIEKIFFYSFNVSESL